jgi:hypothetical protein
VFLNVERGGGSFETLKLYHLSHASISFYVSYFLDRVLCFYPGVTSDHNPHTYASGLAEITGMVHHTQLFASSFFGSRGA